MNDAAAQVEELPRDLGITGGVERGRYKRPVTRPKIAVMVGRTLGHVRVVRREYRASVVYLRADNEQRAFVKIDDRVRQIGKEEVILVDPRTPVILGIGKIYLRSTREHRAVKFIYLVVRRTGCYPVIEFARTIRVECQMDANGRVDRTLGDRAAVEPAVLGIAPCALVLAKRLAAGAERGKVRLGIYQEITMLFVMDESACFRVVKGRVAHLVLVDPEIMM